MSGGLVVWVWSAWLLALIFAAIAIISRDAGSGYSSISLPRLLFFVWLLVCLLALFSLRMTGAALAAGALALVTGGLTFLVRRAVDDRGRELAERLEGARRALRNAPDNSMSLELLGDLYSTVECRELALEHWKRALALRSDSGLREKIAALERPEPLFHYWGEPAAREWRACPACGGLARRLARRCSSCRRPFRSAADWLSAAVDRFCEEHGADRLLRMSLYLLPFLFLLGAAPYALLWLAWAVAAKARERFSSGDPFRRHAVRLLMLWALAFGAQRAGARLVLDPKPLREAGLPPALVSWLTSAPGASLAEHRRLAASTVDEARVADAIRLLGSRDEGLRLFGAQQLNSEGLAVHPLAQAARSELRAALESEDPRVAEEAAGALKRLDAVLKASERR